MRKINFKFKIALIAFYAVVFLPFTTFAFDWSDTSPQASGYLDSHDVTIVSAPSNTPLYMMWEFPDGQVADFVFDIAGPTYHLSPSGPFGDTNWSAYCAVYCSPTSVPDFTVDGDYTVSFYADQFDRSTPLETNTFCQGSGCSGPPPTPSVLEATSSIDQVQRNLLGGISFIFLPVFFFMVWFFKRRSN